MLLDLSLLNREKKAVGGDTFHGTVAYIYVFFPPVFMGSASDEMHWDITNT